MYLYRYHLYYSNINWLLIKQPLTPHFVGIIISLYKNYIICWNCFEFKELPSHFYRLITVGLAMFYILRVFILQVSISINKN